MSQKSLKTLSLLLGLLVTPSLSLVAADDQYLFKSDDSTVEDLLNNPGYLDDKLRDQYLNLLKLIKLNNNIKCSVRIDRSSPNDIVIDLGSSDGKTFTISSERLRTCLIESLLKIAIQLQANPPEWLSNLRLFLAGQLPSVYAAFRAMDFEPKINSLKDQVTKEYQLYIDRKTTNGSIPVDSQTTKTTTLSMQEAPASSKLVGDINAFLSEVKLILNADHNETFCELNQNSSLAASSSKLGDLTLFLQELENKIEASIIQLNNIFDYPKGHIPGLVLFLNDFLKRQNIRILWALNAHATVIEQSVQASIKKKSACYTMAPFSFCNMAQTSSVLINHLQNSQVPMSFDFGNNIFENSGVEDFYIPPVSCKVDPKVFGGSHVNQLFIPQGYNGSFAELNTWCYSMANKDFDATKPINKENEPNKDNNYGSGNVAFLVDHADCFPRILIKKNEERNATPQTGSGTTPANPQQQAAVTLTKDIVAAALAYRNDGKTSVSRCTPVTIIVDESITSIEADAFAPLKDFIVGRMVLTPSARLCQSLKTTSTSLFDRNHPQSIKVNQLSLRGPNVQSFIDNELENVFSGARFHRVNIVSAMKSFDQSSLKFLENTGVEQLYIAGPVGSVGPCSVANLAGLKRLEFNPMGQHMKWSDPEKPVFDTSNVYHFNPLYRLDNKQPAFIRKEFDWKKEYRTSSVAYADKWPDSPFANSTLEYVNIPYYVTGFKANWCSGCQNLKEVECYRFKGNHSYNWGTLSKKVMAFFSNVPTGCTINFASGHMTKVEKDCLDGLIPELKNSIKIKISLNHAQFKKDGLSKDILPLPNIVGVGLPWNYPHPLKDDLFESCNNGQINKDFELWMSDYCNITATSISDVYAKKTGLNSWYYNFSDGPCLQFHKHGEEPTTSTK